ncbi:hypothetical protein AAG906_025517 [Vitis piasezkii]
MKLNPTKCAFGVSAGNFLGFMVTQRRIEVNPDKKKVVLETPTPNSKKELQHLTGHLAALRHFIACFIDKLRPFFLTLKGASTFGWTDECKQTFEIVKRYLTEPSILSNLKSGEQLYIYLAISECAQSNDKRNDSILQNGANAPNPEERHLEALPVLPGSSSDHTHKPATLSYPAQVKSVRTYIGLILQSPTEELLEQVIYLNFSTSNNETEYEVVLVGLDLALTLAATKLEIRSNFQLVVGGSDATRLPPSHNLNHTEPIHMHQSSNMTNLGTSSLHEGYYWPTMKQDWVEAEAYASIKGKDVSKFVWKNIVCRFGFPRAIVANNGPLFDRILFRTFYSELNIKNLYSTPHYPQSNGQADATNKTLLSALKKMLKNAKGKWVDELHGVLWAYRTTSTRPIGTTPFTLAYGMEAIIPTKIGMPTARKTVQNQRGNDEELIR